VGPLPPRKKRFVIYVKKLLAPGPFDFGPKGVDAKVGWGRIPNKGKSEGPVNRAEKWSGCWHQTGANRWVSQKREGDEGPQGSGPVLQNMGL